MKHLIFLLACLLTVLKVYPQSGFSIREVKDSLFIPWEIIYGPDDYIWFTQKDGYVCKLEPFSGNVDTIYLEGQNVIRGEGGMLGMALHPSFATDPYVFIAYEYEELSEYKLKVVKFTYVNQHLINPQILLDNIKGNSNHNGCRLAIMEDKLFITTGDAQNTSLSQNISSMNGKVLRINLDGSVPEDNPIVGSPVWSWGHRNAQGLAYHNGILYSTEHGPNNDDEINVILRGRNYGWPNVDGFCDLPAEKQYCLDSNIVEPLYAWTPTLAVSAIAYYNHPMFPQFSNSLLMTTLKDGKLYKLQMTADGDSIINIVALPGINFGRLRAITISPEGRVFISTSNSNASGNGARIDKIIELYDSATSSALYNFQVNGNRIMIYPNPAMDVMNIAFLDDNMLNYTWDYSVSNIQGQVFQNGPLEYSTIQTGSLYPGVYFLKMWNQKNVMIYKCFVKW